MCPWQIIQKSFFFSASGTSWPVDEGSGELSHMFLLYSLVPIAIGDKLIVIGENVL